MGGRPNSDSQSRCQAPSESCGALKVAPSAVDRHLSGKTRCECRERHVRDSVNKVDGCQAENCNAPLILWACRCFAVFQSYPDLDWHHIIQTRCDYCKEKQFTFVWTCPVCRLEQTTEGKGWCMNWELSSDMTDKHM